MKFNKFQKKGSHAHAEVELPLAPMASVFTVILVFLIKSASMSVTSITPSADIDLPEVTTVSEIPEALKIQISSSGITVADKPIVEMQDYVPKERTPASEEFSVSKLLEKALQFEKGENKAEQDSKLVIIADKKAPYQLLKQIMSAAANVGFLDLKLVVIGGE